MGSGTGKNRGTETGWVLELAKIGVPKLNPRNLKVYHWTKGSRTKQKWDSRTNLDFLCAIYSNDKFLPKLKYNNQTQDLGSKSTHKHIKEGEKSLPHGF